MCLTLTAVQQIVCSLDVGKIHAGPISDAAALFVTMKALAISNIVQGPYACLQDGQNTWIACTGHKAALIQPDDHANVLLLFNVIQVSEKQEPAVSTPLNGAGKV